MLFTANLAHAQTIFVASTPCSFGTRPLPGIPADAGCELIKWQLKLFGSGALGTYILDCDYGLPKQGTRGFIHGGKHLHREGKWTVVKGNTYPNAEIYRLDPDQPKASISFIRLNENLLHLLDSDQHLMIGTGGWSYTLSKVKP
ncbi:MAG: hypothetical protein ACXVJB_08215 [Mucilaginibacter sp.]